MNKMNRRISLAAMAAAIVMEATAGINTPEAAGYIERGKLMYLDTNYNGCIDQMLQARHLSPDGPQAEEAFYYTAMSTLGLGDDEALALLESFLAHYPQSPRRQDVLMALGDYFFTRGNYSDAIRRYRRVAPECLEPSTAEDYRYRLAYSYMMLTEYDQAEPLFNELRPTKRYGNAALFYQAYMAYSRQDYPRALQLFKNVDTAVDPGNTADYYLAQLYFMKGEYRQALGSARRIINLNPVPEFSTEAKRIAGESLYNLGDTEAAIPLLWEYVAAADEPLPSAYYILGVNEFNAGQYDAAARLLQQATGANNAMAQNAYLYLGQCYLKTGNNNSALMAFENAYRMNYDPKVQETAFYNYAVARSEGGKAPFSSSVAIFEDFLNQYPTSRYAPEIEEYLINGYMTDDDYESALASINRIAQPSEKVLNAKQRVLFVLGTRDYANGHPALALSRFEQAEATGSDPLIARQAKLWSGDCHFAEEQWDKASQCYRAFLAEAPADDPNRQLAWYDLGYSLYNRKEYSEALTAFGKAVATGGSLNSIALADAYNRMGDCRLAAHEFKSAATDYQKAYDLNPSSGDYALYRLAMTNGYQGNNTRKIQLLEQMMDRHSSSPLVPAALLAMAETYSVQGNNSKAISTYNRLVRDYPQSSYGRNGQLQLAISYLNTGDRPRAIEAYRKVIYTYPTSDEARVAADDLRRIYAEDGKLADYLAFMNSVPNAPEVDPSEIEASAYDVAEEWYLADKGTSKLKAYLKDYPNGANVASALYYLAEDAEDKGAYEEAYRYATRIIMTYPDSEVAETALAIKASCELHEGKGEIALESYRQLEQKASTPAMLHEARMQAMRVARDLGRNADVVTTAEKILGSSATGSGELDEVHFTHAFALYRMGRHDEAIKEWKTLAATPDNLYGAKAAFYTAQSQYDRNQLAQAQKSIENFLDTDSSQAYWRARGVILLSDILRKQGNTFEADQYLRSLRNNYSDPSTQVEIASMVDQRLSK